MSSIDKDSYVNIYNNTQKTNESLQNDGDKKPSINYELTQQPNETQSRFAKNALSDQEMAELQVMIEKIEKEAGSMNPKNQEADLPVMIENPINQEAELQVMIDKIEKDAGSMKPKNLDNKMLETIDHGEDNDFAPNDLE